MVKGSSSRRRLLSSLALASSIAGCSTRPLLPNGSDDIDTSRRFEWVTLRNLHDIPHTFTIRIERNGERVLTETNTLPGKSDAPDPGKRVDNVGENLSETGRFVVHGRMDRGQWQTIHATDVTEGRCYTVEYRANDQGELAVWRSKNKPCNSSI